MEIDACGPAFLTEMLFPIALVLLVVGISATALLLWMRRNPDLSDLHVLGWALIVTIACAAVGLVLLVMSLLTC